MFDEHESFIAMRHGAFRREIAMAKGNDKKPKQAPKGAVSSYKASQSANKAPVSPFAKKPGK
jgi:hypothetical protein